ncbi:MAG: hypothetical protein HOM34_10005, partial [Planctomycetes bacterium]|nr:hypothetical protein [Planctomycetota bacterium]
ETLGGEDKDSWATIAAIPLALPLGLIDVVVVHPAQVIDDAANDTWDLLWEQSVKGSAMRSFVALPRLALTPVVFCGDWLGRSLFDIPPHGAKTVASTKPMTEQEREQTMKRIAQLEKDIIRLRERLDSH